MRSLPTLCLALLFPTFACALDLSPAAEKVFPAAAATTPLSRLLGEGELPASLSTGQCYEWKWQKDGVATGVTACEFTLPSEDLELLPVFKKMSFQRRPTAIVAPTLVERRYVAIPDRWTDFKPRAVYFQSPPEAWKSGDILLYTDGDGSRYVALRTHAIPK